MVCRKPSSPSSWPSVSPFHSPWWSALGSSPATNIAHAWPGARVGGVGEAALTLVFELGLGLDFHCVPLPATTFTIFQLLESI